jgi:two-component system chemotaxis sensor kinase CheA
MFMKSKDAEYKEIFLAEALEHYEEINRLLTVLEKNPGEKKTIHALFRITHTLKGNSSGMGFTGISEMGHVLEDLFGEVRDGKVTMDEQIFSSVFKAVDVLGKLINAIRDNTEVQYKGIKTKLAVLVKRSSESLPVQETEPSEDTEKALLVESKDPIEASVVNTPSRVIAEDPISSEKEDSKITFSDLVQVPVWKLDNLLNLVGELIIEKDRILASHTGLYASNEYARLSRISSDLQYSVMDVRLVQVGFLFNKFHRVIRDAAAVEKKNVNLKLEGTDTEIDRNVLQVISDSLIHIMRNAVAHGIEDSKEREKTGKPKEGNILLSARNETDAVVIEIKDDGKGLDYDRIKSKALSKGLIPPEAAEKLTNDELSMLIFEPGFSTVDQITTISGRGVGMDVVKRTLDSIGGGITIQSEKGKGTTIQLTLPLSMAVKPSLLFELDRETYAIPLSYTESVTSLFKNDIHKAGAGLVASYAGKNIAIVFLKDLFGDEEVSKTSGNVFQKSFDDAHPEEKLEVVVVNYNKRIVGFVVDKLLQQKEIVEKPLMKPVDRIKFISGVTILGNGRVCLVLNIPFVLHFIFNASIQGKMTKNFNLN